MVLTHFTLLSLVLLSIRLLKARGCIAVRLSDLGYCSVCGGEAVGAWLTLGAIASIIVRTNWALQAIVQAEMLAVPSIYCTHLHEMLKDKIFTLRPAACIACEQCFVSTGAHTCMYVPAHNEGHQFGHKSYGRANSRHMQKFFDLQRQINNHNGH